MRRGKVIGAIVLVVAIGIVIVRLLGEPDAGGAADSAASSAAAGAGQAAAGVPSVPSGVLPPPGTGRVYTIDPMLSEVYWRIYRSGTLARLGHNHVISMTGMSGSVNLTSDLAAAEWSLAFPVAGLVIDEPELRARYGEDFESVPTDDDKADTRTNMLTEGLLNGAAYPEIRLSGTGVYGTLEAAEIPMTIEIVGQSVEQTFPAALAIDVGTVTVSGEYRLTHQDLGLTPFSLFGGTLAVGDAIDFTYRITAVASGQ